MSLSNLDHVYLSVQDLERAISFYEAFLGMEVQHRFKSRWADFNTGQGFYLGLYNPKFDNQEYTKGTNVTIGFHTDDIEEEHKRVSSLDPNTISEIRDVNFIMPYRFFQFEDPEGNIIEVSQYRNLNTQASEE